jgi:plastocyanin
MRKRAALPWFAILTSISLLTVAGQAGTPNVKGKIAGQEKLVAEVYAEATKPESRRWTWREPSPSVAAQFRTLSANPSRDLCIAATSSANSGPQEAIRMTVTGGRVYPTTIVVSPGTPLAFKNFDPFKHRLYVVGNPSFKAEDLGPNQSRSWSASGAGKYEVRDELFPSVRTFVIVDPQVVQVAYPGRDGAFGFSLPAGDYVLKVFFAGKQVGKSVTVNAKEKAAVELKDPLNVGTGEEKQDSK